MRPLVCCARGQLPPPLSYATASALAKTASPCLFLSKLGHTPYPSVWTSFMDDPLHRKLQYLHAYLLIVYCVNSICCLTLLWFFSRRSLLGFVSKNQARHKTMSWMQIICFNFCTVCIISCSLRHSAGNIRYLREEGYAFAFVGLSINSNSCRRILLEFFGGV